jgi:hypothetical protein
MKNRSVVWDASTKRSGGEHASSAISDDAVISGGRRESRDLLFADSRSGENSPHRVGLPITKRARESESPLIEAVRQRSAKRGLSTKYLTGAAH